MTSPTLPTLADFDIFHLESALWLVIREIGVPNYDYRFTPHFECRHPWQRPAAITAAARVGVVDDYADLHAALAGEGVRLVHDPAQYRISSQLSGWYPLIESLTPRSQWFDTPPPADWVEAQFGWPVFLKGDRQTSRHRAAHSIIRSAAAYAEAIDVWRRDPILHWQKLVLRQFIPLRPVAARETDRIPPSFEFRCFFWRGQCVGFGPYWAAFASYQCTRLEELRALRIAQQAADRINLPFVVIDVAQAASGEWIVIECNDGQESGYAGIPPLVLWHRIVDIERSPLHRGAAGKSAA
jgi:hypothetical protein